MRRQPGRIWVGVWRLPRCQAMRARASGSAAGCRARLRRGADQDQRPSSRARRSPSRRTRASAGRAGRAAVVGGEPQAAAVAVVEGEGDGGGGRAVGDEVARAAARGRRGGSARAPRSPASRQVVQHVADAGARASLALEVGVDLSACGRRHLDTAWRRRRRSRRRRAGSGAGGGSGRRQLAVAQDRPEALLGLGRLATELAACRADGSIVRATASAAEPQNRK